MLDIWRSRTSNCSVRANSSKSNDRTSSARSEGPARRAALASGDETAPMSSTGFSPGVPCVSSGMFSPNHRSRFQKCPVCDKDVHKVLLQTHVEVCLERGAGAGPCPSSAGKSSETSDDHKSNSNWGRTIESNHPDYVRPFQAHDRPTWHTTNNQSEHAGAKNTNSNGFTNAGAFAKHLGIDGNKNDGIGTMVAGTKDTWTTRTPLETLNESTNDGRGVFVKAGRNNSDGKKSVGPLSGWAKPITHFESSKRHGSDDLEQTPACKKPAIQEDVDTCGINTEEKCSNEDDASHEEDKDDELWKNQREEDALADVGDGGVFNFPVRVMSGDHRDCGICLQRFCDEQGVKRHVLWPCQHARQCGDCAIRIWQVPKQKRRCPWCKSKIDIRPRPFMPFL